MELLDVSLTPLQRRNRAAFVARAGGCEVALGEPVVLRDERGDYFAGIVVDLDAQRYVIRVGVRLPEEYAMLRLGRRGRGAPSGTDDDAQSMLDLLGDAREARGRLPSQRRATDPT